MPQPFSIEQLAYILIAGFLTQILKQVKFPKKWAGVLSLLLGVLSSILWTYVSRIETAPTTQELLQNIQQGILGGLCASGIYSTGKAALKKKQPAH